MSELDVLKMLLENAGVGWVFRGNEQQSLQGLLEDVRAIEAQHLARYQSKVDLLDQCRERFEDMRPFIRSLAVPMTREFRLLVLRLLMGDEIQAVQFEYELRSSAKLRIQLAGQDQPFRSDNIWDFDVLRHMGSMKVSSRPVLHGYYDFLSK